MRISCLLIPLFLMAQEKPVTLYPGTGIWKHPIATRSPEAQKFFDQGLVLMYGFNRPEALRIFPRLRNIMRIQRKDRIPRRIPADPSERLFKLIGRIRCHHLLQRLR